MVWFGAAMCSVRCIRVVRAPWTELFLTVSFEAGSRSDLSHGWSVDMGKIDYVAFPCPLKHLVDAVSRSGFRSFLMVIFAHSCCSMLFLQLKL